MIAVLLVDGVFPSIIKANLIAFSVPVLVPLYITSDSSVKYICLLSDIFKKTSKTINFPSELSPLPSVSTLLEQHIIIFAFFVIYVFCASRVYV